MVKQCLPTPNSRQFPSNTSFALFVQALDSIAKHFGEKRLRFIGVDDFQELVDLSASFLPPTADSLVEKLQQHVGKTYGPHSKKALHILFDAFFKPLLHKAEETKKLVPGLVHAMGNFKFVDDVVVVLLEKAVDNIYFTEKDALSAVKKEIKRRIGKLEAGLVVHLTTRPKPRSEIFQRRAVSIISAEKREVWSESRKGVKDIRLLTSTGNKYDVLRSIENCIEDLEVKLERAQWFAVAQKEKYLHLKESELVTQKKHAYTKNFVLDKEFASKFSVERTHITSFASKEGFLERYGDKAEIFWEMGVEEREIEILDLFEEFDSEAAKLEKELDKEKRRLAARMKELVGNRSKVRASLLQLACGDDSAWIDDAMKAQSVMSPAAMERLTWWVFSRAGCTGKSKVFGQRLVREKGAFVMPVVAVNPKTGNAVLQKGTSLLSYYADAVSAAVEGGLLDPANAILLFDFPRSAGGLSVDGVLIPNGFYTVCEQIKTGSFFNAKYSGKLSSVGRAPFIVVTANGPPPLSDGDISRCGAISYDRIEALQISANQKQVGAHIATKERLLQLGKRMQQDDDSQADFDKKSFGFDPETLHAGKRQRLAKSSDRAESSGHSSDEDAIKAFETEWSVSNLSRHYKFVFVGDNKVRITRDGVEFVMKTRAVSEKPLKDRVASRWSAEKNKLKK